MVENQLLHVGFEAVTGPLEEGGNGVGSDAEEGGDLGVGEAVAVVQHQNQPFAGREGVESGRNLGLAFRVEELFERAGGGGGGCREIASFLAAQRAESLMAGDADEPGGKAAAALEGAEELAVVFEEGGEDFLRHVLGGVPDDGGGGADDEGLHVAGEALPRGGIGGEESLDGRQVLGGAHHSL